MSPAVPEKKKAPLGARICLAAALLTAAGSFALALLPSRGPLLVTGVTGEPRETAARFFNALCLGDWAEAARCVEGEPSLGLEPPEDEPERQIWDAYRQSWGWSPGETVRTDALTAEQTVDFTALRPELLLAGIDEDVETVLRQRVDGSEALSEIYEEDGSFRAEVVRQALSEALKARLATPGTYTDTITVTLRLRYRDGAWRIVPEDGLWRTLSGEVGS